MAQNFQTVSPGCEAARPLVTLSQGKRSVLNYAIEFCMLAAESGLNEPELVDPFFYGMSERLKDHLRPLNLHS